MEKFDFVAGLAAVITGVGLSDVAVSLHRLLKRRNRISWDWLPIALAGYGSLVLMRLWYQYWSIHEVGIATTLPFVTAQVVQTLVLVLMVSASLPDEDDFSPGRIDLSRYYATHGRYVWTLYFAFIVMWAATALFVAASEGRIEALARPYPLAFFIIPSVLAIVAPMVGRRWQGGILIALLAHELLIPWNLLGLR